MTMGAQAQAQLFGGLLNLRRLNFQPEVSSDPGTSWRFELLQGLERKSLKCVCKLL